jgi:hypothetical protein
MSAAEAKQDTSSGTTINPLTVEERKPFDKYQMASTEQAALESLEGDTHPFTSLATRLHFHRSNRNHRPGPQAQV